MINACRYLSSKEPLYVDYLTFSDEVESIFTTKHLEKTPTAKVVQFVPKSDIDCNLLSPNEEQVVQNTLQRLAERVRFHYYIIITMQAWSRIVNVHVPLICQKAYVIGLL